MPVVLIPLTDVKSVTLEEDYLVLGFGDRTGRERLT